MTTLTSPHDLLAAIPFLIGYHPTDSLVLVSLKAGTVAMAMRVDYPKGDKESVSPQDCDALVAHLKRDGADGALLVAYMPDDETSGEVLLGELARALAREEIALNESLLISNGRWRSTICMDPICCPPQGRELPEITSSRVAVEQVSNGHPMPFASADDLTNSIGPLPLAEDENFRSVVSNYLIDPDDAKITVKQREGAIAVIDLVSLFITGSVGKNFQADQDLCAKVIGSLTDIQVRDFALGSHTEATQEIYWHMWRYLVRIAPTRFVAPVASLLAASSYEKGEGALAQRALDRAQADGPDYSLAILLRRVFSAGWPPRSFAQMRKELHPKVCAAIFETRPPTLVGNAKGAVEKGGEVA